MRRSHSSTTAHPLRVAWQSASPLSSTTTNSMETFDFFQWHWWVAAALILFIAEIMLPGFWVLCLGIGAMGGAIAAALGLDANWQLLFFSGFSLVAFFAIRPLLMKRERNRPVTRTNVDALQGQRGKVTQDFDPSLRLGRVAVGGDDWRAEAIDDRMLRVGDVVEVIRVESNTVIVRPIERS
jgi:membrane protein implicated in regulation of membrane protease activity